MYDEINRFHRITTNPEEKNRLLQKGLRENLLCGTCEQHIGNYERYASLALKGGIGLDYRNEGNKIFISGLDYQKFKLFQLSILWRASISNRPEFRQVKLGRHENIIRKRLLDGSPGGSKDYGCLMMAIRHEGKPVTDLIVEPTPSRILDHKCYRFVFGGFAWLYIVSSHNLPKIITDNFVTENGSCVIQYQEIERMKFLVDTAVKMRGLGKLS